MEIVVAPTSAFDLLEAVDDQGRPGRWHRTKFGLFARQVAGGPAMTVRVDGALALAVGLWPEEDHAEAWFAAGEGLGPALLPVIRRARGVFESLAAHAAPIEVRAYIHPASVAGARLAALFGFTASGHRDSPAGPLEIWTRRFT